MKNQMKFVSILLSMCMCLLCVSCNPKPEAEISFLSMEEAGVTDPNTTHTEIWVYSSRKTGEEAMSLKIVESQNLTYSVVVATVLEQETKTIMHAFVPSQLPMPVSCVTSIVEINDVLLGDYKIGSKIYFLQEAKKINNVYYPYHATQISGGFLKTGTKMLLFLVEAPEYAKKIYGEKFKYPVRVPANCGFSNRVVQADGTLEFLEKNIEADITEFAQYQTVEEVRAALPQIFETYRDTYKVDYSLIDTYHAAPNAEPSMPEGYIPYAELPETAK